MKSVIFDKLPMHDTCWSITTGRDGNIYIGVCGELVDALSVFITRYDPLKDNTDYMLEVAPALNETPDNGRAPICKLHYGLLPGSDGKLYCATHYSGPPVGDFIWRPWHTWDDSERMARGFNIFSYDTTTEEVEDFGVMSPNEGSRAMALAEERGLLYGITWPRDHFYIYDLNKRRYRDLGRIGDTNAQSIWVDAAGNGYTADDLGQIVKYDVDADRLMRLDVHVPKDPAASSQERSVYDVTPAPDGKSVYGVTWNMERVPFISRFFRYHFSEGRIDDLGQVPGTNHSNHAGGLIFGDDGYLYYAASRKDDSRRIPYRMYLFRMNPETLEQEEISAFDDGDYHAEYISRATKDFAGNLYFADTNNRPGRMYIYTPQGSGKNYTPRWPLAKTWG
ncbi:MAG: hypothetical protein WC074_06685 [bacterium]